MNFEAYGKTKNSYDGKTINMWTSKYPDLLTERFCATEKLDGTNFSIWIDSDGACSYGKRSSQLGYEENFFNWQDVMSGQYHEEMCKLSTYCEESGDEIRIFGELYGKGIQRRIDYGEKKFSPFQLEINGKRVSPYAGMMFMTSIVGYTWWVPVLGVMKNLEDALSCDPDELNMDIEGIVLEPFDVPFDDDSLGKFKLKVKTTAFCETMAVKKKRPKQKDPMSDAAEALKGHYLANVNKNRLECIESKEGALLDHKEIGKYIKLLCTDAKEDFLNIHKKEFILLDDKEKKGILGSAGRYAASVVKGALESNLKGDK